MLFGLGHLKNILRERYGKGRESVVDLKVHVYLCVSFIKTLDSDVVFLGVESRQSGKSAAGKNKSMAAR